MADKYDPNAFYGYSHRVRNPQGKYYTRNYSISTGRNQLKDAYGNVFNIKDRATWYDKRNAEDNLGYFGKEYTMTFPNIEKAYGVHRKYNTGIKRTRAAASKESSGSKSLKSSLGISSRKGRNAQPSNPMSNVEMTSNRSSGLSISQRVNRGLAIM